MKAFLKPTVYAAIERDLVVRRAHGIPLPTGYIVHPDGLVQPLTVRQQLARDARGAGCQQ